MWRIVEVHGLAIGVAAGVAITSVRLTHAQETINQATIAGRVFDPQGAVVPGAIVSVRQTDTNIRAEASTDTDGRFRFPYLRIGPYELRVNVPGFEEHARTLVLSAGSALTF
jgi:protocatechuate 3,4-dioxygenase beta subunit